MICPNCGSGLTEPQKSISGDWYNTCPSCRGTHKIAPESPLLQSYQQNFEAYPQGLKDVASPQPWGALETGRFGPGWRMSSIRVKAEEDAYDEKWDPYFETQEHDYDPRADYEIRPEHFTHPLHQIAQARMDELAARPDTPFNRGPVYPARLDAENNPSGQDAAGVYASGTYNEPIVMMDYDIHQDPDVISPEDEVRRTVDHEVGHAIQEHRDPDAWGDEDEAEGWRFTSVRLGMAVPLYHLAPTAARESIQQHGLIGNEREKTQSPWTQDLGQPSGNYFFDNPEDAHDYAYTVHSKLYPNRSPKPFGVNDQGMYPGDEPDQFADYGVYDGQVMGDGPQEGEDEDDYDAWENAVPYDHNNPNHRGLLPNHLKGYDIWHVPPHAVTAERDPENVLMHYDRGWDENEHPEEEGGWITQEQAEGQIDPEDPSYHGTSPNRYLVQHPVPPENLTLHQHIPAWELTSDGFNDRVEGVTDRLYPEPLHRTQIDWPSYQVPENKWGATTFPPQWNFSKASSHRPHYNDWSGEPCNCPWGSGGSILHRVAGRKTDWVLKSPDKQYQTPEGKEFLQHLQGLPQEYDALAPYIAQRYKHGEVVKQPTYYKHEGELTVPGVGSRRYFEPGDYQLGPADQLRQYRSLGQHLPEWNQWFQAKQHPTRRGVNIMDPNFTVHDMHDKVKEHQEALAAEELQERGLQHGEVVHKFPNGWHIRHLNPDGAQADEIYEGMGAEGEAMSHCIGNSESPNYREEAEGGNINVYSLRDKKNWPHATWHYNDDGTLAEKFGRSDAALKPEYQAMLDEWGKKTGQDVGYGEGHHGAAEGYYTAAGAGDMESYYENHHPDGSPMERAWQQAQDEGVNVDDNTEFDWDRPDIHSVARDFHRNGGEDDLERLHEAAENNGDLPEFDREFENIGLNEGDKSHWEALRDQPQSVITWDHEPRDVHSYMAMHHPDHPNWTDYAEDNHGYDFDENTQFHNYGNPNWHGIASDLYTEPDDSIDDVFDTAAENGSDHLQPLHEAVNAHPVEDDEMQRVKDYWNNLYQQYTGEQADADTQNSMRVNEMLDAWGNKPPGQIPEPPPTFGQGTFAKLMPARAHPNYATGEPCYCGFDYTKHLPRTASIHLGDKLNDFLMSPNHRPDLQTPEAQAFLGHLKRHYHNEKTDALMPWLTREWKKGRIQYEHPDPNDPFANPNVPALRMKLQGPTEYGSSHRFHPNDLNHWADFYHSKDPERRGLGDLMQHDTDSYKDQIRSWNEGMANREAAESAHHGTVVHTTPDNWTIRQLHTPEELKAEGNNMGHCVGGYHDAVDSEHSMIYSLRDPQGQPHATTEIAPQLHEWTDHNGVPHRTDMKRTNVDDRSLSTHAIPHGGQVVQIQGKQNQEPIPEYKARLKHWFDSFSPEDKPQWDPGSMDSGYDLWQPDDIRDEDMNPSPNDGYGLARPQRNVDWPTMMGQMVHDDYDRGYNYRRGYDPSHGEAAFELAKARGEIPQFATAFGNWQDKTAQPSIDGALEANWEYMPQYNEEDPDFDQGYYDDQYARAENEILEDNPYHHALNHFNELLSPHWDNSTMSYQNVPDQPATFSSRMSDWYHLAPTTERDRIQQHGLMPADPFGSEHAWGGVVRDQPMGVYAWPNAEQAEGWSHSGPSDIWRIPSDQVQENYEDRALGDFGAQYIPHQVNPVLHLPYENSADYELQFGAK